ncbi:MAG: terminase large subunit [Bradyrhizobium sp.]|nr:terminase large subunit [Bradyrhizobium sp.]
MPPRRRTLRHAWEHAPRHRSVGELERQAYDRHAADLRGGKERGLYFDDRASQRAIGFIETYCRHSKGEWSGKQFILEGWQRFLVGSLFGWHRADGTRRFRLCYIQLARKNGKTQLLAAIGLYLLVADSEPGSEVYSAATKRDQAKIMFDEAAKMVRGSPSLASRLEVVGGRPQSRSNNICCVRLNSKFEPLSSDRDSQDGLNIHGALIDELHRHRDGEMFDVLETGTGARRQPIIAAITTPGTGQSGICHEQRVHSGQVLDGTVQDDAYLAYVCEPDDGADWADEASWEQGNPNIDVSVKRDQLREKCKRAQGSPARQNMFRRLHCGQWTEQVDRWLDMDRWSACGGAIDPATLRGRACYGGLDLASTTDLAAFVLDFPPTADGPHVLLAWCWCPEDNLDERTRNEETLFRQWIASGDLEATDGNVINYAVIRETINDAARQFDLRQIGYDPWNATQLATQLQDEDGLDLVKMRQGVGGMSGPCKEFEKLVRSGELAHGDHPVMRWCANNIGMYTDGNDNIKPSRTNSGGRIDLIVAGVMAVGLAVLGGGGVTSVYEDPARKVIAI